MYFGERTKKGKGGENTIGFLSKFSFAKFSRNGRQNEFRYFAKYRTHFKKFHVLQKKRKLHFLCKLCYVCLIVRCLATCNYDVWLPLHLNELLPVWYLPTCMSAYLEDVWSAAWCMPAFMMSACLYKICLPEWGLPTGMMSRVAIEISFRKNSAE